MAITTSEREYLLNNMKDLLEEYGYEYTEDALNKIIDEWSSQKAGLIDAFKKHSNYIEGKFMIAFDADYERTIDKVASYVFRDWLMSNMREAKPNFPKEIQDRTDYGDYLPWGIFRFIDNLNRYAERCVSEETARHLNEICPEVRVHAGQKTSRIVNKLLCYLGFDKIDGYNREFAKYADSLSPLTIKRHTILSLNPLDYLTMSFGNSWASCHTIDKKNRRGMPNNYSGCYSSGTISYMLDPSSMVLYTVDAAYNGNEYWTQPKINRQMFHYGEEKLVQARLYPQDNDGADSVYTPYRNIVQDIISTIFNFPNLWTLSKGIDNASRYIYSYGTHYRDYEHYNNCSLSRVKGSENDESFVVGARPICVNCGERHSTETNINHCGYARCADCGCQLSEEDAIEIDGEIYCRGCCHWCERCDQYVHEDTTWIEGYGHVCATCLDRDFMYCEVCESYEREEEMTWIECEDRYVCDHCLSRYYSYCEDCGEYYPDDDMHTYRGTQLCEDCYDARVENENNSNEDDEAC